MKYIFANWKSNKNVETANEWLDGFEKLTTKNEIILCPPFNILGGIYKRAEKLGFVLGVQDLSPYSAGSYTGEISSVNLEEMDVKYAILGHSERRIHLGEDDILVAKKVDQAVDAKITPVVCVDEGYIESQANAIDDDSLSKCIVAYEPLSAIGTGKEMDVEKVTQVVDRIKKAFGNVKVIYGGSVDETNVISYLRACDGVLVGGASLEVKSFINIIN